VGPDCLLSRSRYRIYSIACSAQAAFEYCRIYSRPHWSLCLQGLWGRWPIMGPERPKLGPINGLWGSEAWAHMGPSLGPSWPYGGPKLWPIMGPEKLKFGSIIAHKGGHRLRPSCAHRGPNFGPAWAPGRPKLGPIMGPGSPKLGLIMGLWEAQAWFIMGL
jgi:hypothetical protein